MKIYGETIQEGEPTPENPKPIENYVIIENKNGKKIKLPLDYIVRKEYKLKEGDQIEKIEDQYYLCKSKNLFDTGEIIKKEINYIKETSNIINTEMNEFTLKYLNNLGIYSIDNKAIIINNNLENYQLKINREKRNES